MAKRLVRAKAQDPPRRHPVPRAAGAPAARAHRRACSPCSTCCSTRATPPRAGADLVRQDLCAEAIRLARTARRADARRARGAGLLALMLLHDARRAGPRRRRRRPGDPRGPGPLAAGTAREIDEGVALLDAALRRGRAGPVPAAGGDRRLPRHRGGRRRHRLGARSPRLYERLAQLVPSPVVELNRAVAVAMADGPGGRAGAGRRAGRVRGARRLPPAAGDPRRPAAPARPPRRGGRGLPRGARAGRPTDAERRYLARRLAEVTGQG